MKHRLALLILGGLSFGACARKAAGPTVTYPALAPVPATMVKAKLVLVTNDTKEAVGLSAAPGEAAGRLFVIEKAGRVRLLRNGQFASRPFLDMTGQVALEGRDNGEQGLLGLAFHPRFAENGRFYIHFTDVKGDTSVRELKVDARDRDVADPASARQLLSVPQPYKNHNAGHLAFGADGKLYVLLGDGGSANDPQGNAQNPNSLLGKMIRIDVDAPDAKSEVIGRGMRNPWRYSFDRESGDLYIADVGQNEWEWIHVLPAANLGGHNLGWNVIEGRRCFKGKACDTKGLTLPVVEYPRRDGCSITGGYVYRGKALPELRGHYFYSDYCTALLRSFRWEGGAVKDHWDWKAALDPEAQLARVAAFGEDQDGELYLVTHEGPIYKLVRR